MNRAPVFLVGNKHIEPMPGRQAALVEILLHGEGGAQQADALEARLP